MKVTHLFKKKIGDLLDVVLNFWPPREDKRPSWITSNSSKFESRQWFLIQKSKSPLKEVLLRWKHPIFRCKMWIIHVIRETRSTKISCCDTRSQKVKSDDRNTMRARSNLLLCSRVKWWWSEHLRPSTWWVLMQSRPLSNPSTLAQAKRICPVLCTTKPDFV